MTGYKKFCRRNGKPALRMKNMKRLLKRRRQWKLSFLLARLRALLPHPLKPKIRGQPIPSSRQSERNSFSSSFVQANNINPRPTLQTSTPSVREISNLPDVRVSRLVGSNLLMIQIMTWKKLVLLSSVFSVLENEDLEVLSNQTISMAHNQIFCIIFVKFLRTTELDIGNVHSKLKSVAACQEEIVSASRVESEDLLNICKTS